MYGCVIPIRPGYAGLLASGTIHEHRASETLVHAVALFSFADGALKVVSHNSVASPLRTVAAIQDMDERFGKLYCRMEEAIAFFDTQPSRAEVRLWDILWQIADATPEVFPNQATSISAASTTPLVNMCADTSCGIRCVEYSCR